MNHKKLFGILIAASLSFTATAYGGFAPLQPNAGSGLQMGEVDELMDGYGLDADTIKDMAPVALKFMRGSTERILSLTDDPAEAAHMVGNLAEDVTRLLAGFGKEMAKAQGDPEAAERTYSQFMQSVGKVQQAYHSAIDENADYIRGQVPDMGKFRFEVHGMFEYANEKIGQFEPQYLMDNPGAFRAGLEDFGIDAEAINPKVKSLKNSLLKKK